MNKMLDLYRYLRAFAIITVSGGFTERFLNLCYKENIHLWDVVCCDGCITAKIYCKDFFKLKKIRNKTGVKIKIKDKCGFVFSLKRNKNRSVLIAGIAVALLFMLLMNQFVWVIDVTGNVNLSKNEILDTVNVLGLKNGTFVPLFDENKAGRELVNLSDGRILWAAINIKGSKASVEVREYNKSKNEENKSSLPCNIVADFNGVILSSETYSGISCTSRGNAVKKGEILISGISENADGSVNLHKADGKLTAFHQTAFDLSFDKKQSSIKLTEHHSFYVLNIFSLHIPLSLKAFSDFDERYEYSKFSSAGGTLLPFGIARKVSVKKQGENIRQKELIEITDEFTELEQNKFKNTLITSVEYNLKNTHGSTSINSDYDCIDFIGKKIDILQEN